MRVMSGVMVESANTTKVAQLAQENAALKATVLHLETLVDKLRFQLGQLARRQFGVSAEGLAQLGLWRPEETPASEAPPIVPTALVPAHERAKPVRRPLPDDLPREVIEVDLAPEQQPCPCCGGARHVIGEEISEKLDIEPARMSVLQYRRKKYACRACEGEVQAAPLPAQVIEQGLATPGLLAYVAVQKFCDHMPLARQTKFFDRHGIELPRSTLTDWMLALGLVTQPLIERLGALLKTTDILGSDDTPLPWQNERAGKTTTARLWVWRGVLAEERPLLLYQFTPDRSGEHAAKFLEGWRGYLQADAYSGYDRNFSGGRIIEVGCMAHARRRYFDIAKNARTPGFAHAIVQQMAELYKIEREAKERNLSPPERQRLRQERAPPLLDDLKERLEAYLPQVPPKGALAEAIGYTLNHWTALTRYLEDGRLEIGRVGKWRGGGRLSLSVAAPFVWRCPSSLAMTPFPLPARRTGRADFPHPALFQRFRPSHSAWQHERATGGSVPEFRRGTGRSIGDTPSRAGPGVASARFASVARRTCRSSGTSVSRGLG
jgi:transposase